MPRVGVRLRQRQAQNPVSPASTTRPRDTSGSRNWHLHKSTQTQKGMSLRASQLQRSSFTVLKHGRRGSPDLGQCIIQHHILVIINALYIEPYSFMKLLNKGKVIRLNLQVRSMSSPLLWFPGSLYFGVNC